MRELISLHGFLGRPADWDFIPSEYLNVNHTPIDLFGFDPNRGLWEAGRSINAIAQKALGEKILMGYSLGGRLALHAIIDQPTLWKGAVIISSHTGLESIYEKEHRVLMDSKWAARFQLDPWDKVIADWNAQPVFCNRDKHYPFENFSKVILSQSLTGWSLGRQENLSDRLTALDLPILWVTGKLDLKFTTLANNLRLSHPLSKIISVPDAAHRVPWEQQEPFIRELNAFLKEII